MSAQRYTVACVRFALGTGPAFDLSPAGLLSRLGYTGIGSGCEDFDGVFTH